MPLESGNSSTIGESPNQLPGLFFSIGFPIHAWCNWQVSSILGVLHPDLPTPISVIHRRMETSYWASLFHFLWAYCGMNVALEIQAVRAPSDSSWCIPHYFDPKQGRSVGAVRWLKKDVDRSCDLCIWVGETEIFSSFYIRMIFKRREFYWYICLLPSWISYVCYRVECFKLLDW